MKFGINTFALKIIAIMAMLTDHVGVVLLPQYGILRIIGRIAFPIFAYLLVEGFLHTHDVKKYMVRMAMFALISEIPFDLAVSGKMMDFGYQNVFFTLLLGLVMLCLMKQMPMSVQGYLSTLAIVLLGGLLRVDYGSWGLLMIFWLYQFREEKFLKMLGIIVINVLFMGGIQIYAVLGLVPIALHNRQEGPKMKAFFYGFYPIHFMIIYLFSIIL